MDPKPWPNDESSELERELLEAARGERMPHALSARMAEGLGLQAGAAASAAAAAPPLFAKTALWGALSLGLAAASTWYATRPAPAAAPAPAAEPPPIAQPIAPPPPAPALAAALPAELVVEQAPAAPSRRAAAPRQPGRGDVQALAEEVELLDRVRAALQERAAPRALALLDQHRRRFTRATLAPEATALRVEALVQCGSKEEARALAARFAGAHPAHPLRAHVAELIAAETSDR